MHKIPLLLNQIPPPRGCRNIGVAGGEASVDDAGSLHAAGAAVVPHDGDGAQRVQHSSIVVFRPEERSYAARRSLDDRELIERQPDPDASAKLEQLLHDGNRSHDDPLRLAAIWRAISKLTQAALFAQDEA